MPNDPAAYLALAATMPHPANPDRPTDDETVELPDGYNYTREQIIRRIAAISSPAFVDRHVSAEDKRRTRWDRPGHANMGRAANRGIATLLLAIRSQRHGLGVNIDPSVLEEMLEQGFTLGDARRME